NFFNRAKQQEKKRETSQPQRQERQARETKEPAKGSPLREILGENNPLEEFFGGLQRTDEVQEQQKKVKTEQGQQNNTTRKTFAEQRAEQYERLRQQIEKDSPSHQESPA